MTDDRQTLLNWIEDDKSKLVQFFADFVAAKSPNPPGDTREATDVIEGYLKNEGMDYEIVAPQPTMPNVISSFDGKVGEGRHLVLNGHIDVFPADEKTPDGHDSFSGRIEDGKVFGRGASDMKSGTAASMFTYVYLNRMRDRLRGKLTLTMVSDEETLGKWGADYLLENYPDAPGDCCLNGEPTSEHTILFAERGFLWVEFTVKATGLHGAMAGSASRNALKQSISLIEELEELSELKPIIPDEISEAIAESNATHDHFPGGSKAVNSISVNIGRIQGGHKVNMMPNECVFEADIRIPIGMTKASVLAEIEKIISKYPQVSIQEMNGHDPTWTQPDDMVDLIRKNVKELKGHEPALLVCPAATDCRLWRKRGIPAYNYGVDPSTMATTDEWVSVEDFLHTVRTHVLTAYDYLKLEKK